MIERVHRTRAKSKRPSADARALEAARIDALYGLEPVFEPGRVGGGLSDFVTVGCPYCGESFGTPIDLTGGSFHYIEDCQICCQPIELSIEVGEEGALERFAARRLD